MSIIDRLPFEYRVGIRYTRAGRRSGRNSFISFISLISMAGIALGVAALIVILSVMNGFQKDVLDRMLSVLAHIEIFEASGPMPDWRASAQQALQHKEVRGAAPYVMSQAITLHCCSDRLPAHDQGLPLLQALHQTVQHDLLARERRQGAVREADSHAWRHSKALPEGRLGQGKLLALAIEDGLAQLLVEALA